MTLQANGLRPVIEQISNNVDRASYKIELNNSKSEVQNVKVVEHFYGDWNIVSSSDPYEKTDAFTAEFRVSVPANGTKTVTYAVENRTPSPIPIAGESSSSVGVSTPASIGVQK